MKKPATKRTAQYWKVIDVNNNTGLYYKYYDEANCILWPHMLFFCGSDGWVSSSLKPADLENMTDRIVYRIR